MPRVWNQEIRSHPMQVCVGPTVYAWLTGLAEDEGRNSPGEVARVIVEAAYKATLLPRERKPPTPPPPPPGQKATQKGTTT